MKKPSLILIAILMTALIVSSCKGGGSNKDESNNDPVSSTEVTIGNQVWMSQNLNVDKFRNGESIPQVKTDDEWNSAAINEQPAWGYYNNDPINGNRYGKLYNWYAVNDTRGLSPAGFHIPSEEEWNTLENWLGYNAGKKMKFTDFWTDNYSEESYWWNTGACGAGNDGQAGNGTNESGFSGLPGGYWSGGFKYIGSYGVWWSKGKREVDRALYYKNGCLNPPLDGSLGEGLSVRCIKD